MEPGSTPAAPKPRLILLALALTLALIGTVGAATGAADDNSNDPKTAVGTTTTTSGLDIPDTTTSSAVPGTAATTLTTLKGTATTRGGSTTPTTAGATPSDCAGTSTTAAPGAVVPPAIGTFTYVKCGSGETVLSRKVAAGSNSGGITRRVIQAASGQFEAYATTAFGANGVIQESAELHAFGFTIPCDWKPDIVEYPSGLAVGKTWSVDSSCSLPQGGKLRVTGTRTVTGMTQLVIGGTTLTAWVIDDLQEQFVTTAQGNAHITSKGVQYFSPAHGLAVYEKATVSATGFETRQPETVEVRLQSLTPAA